jgi:hypothetical protein
MIVDGNGRRRGMSKSLTVTAAVLGLVAFALTGVWAFFAPRSFFDTVANYPPYNRHLFHDLGAFNLGLAAALALGVWRRRALVVGLGGGAVAAVMHAVAHWLDRNQGGRTSDPWLLSLFALVLVAATLVAWQQDRSSPID